MKQISQPSETRPSDLTDKNVSEFQGQQKKKAGQHVRTSSAFTPYGRKCQINATDPMMERICPSSLMPNIRASSARVVIKRYTFYKSSLTLAMRHVCMYKNYIYIVTWQ